MKPIDRLLALTQIALTFAILGLTAAVILIYETGLAHMGANQEQLFDRLLQWLEGLVMLAVIFWLGRQRSGGIPDAVPTITQTQIAPDGTKHTITSPAHLPLPPIPNPIQPPSAAK